MFLKNGTLMRGKFFCKGHVKVISCFELLAFFLKHSFSWVMPPIQKSAATHFSDVVWLTERYFGHHSIVFVLPFWSDNLLFDTWYVTCYCTVWPLCRNFNPIQDGVWGQKGSTTNFFPVASTNVGISPKNILTFSFNLIATLL